MKLYYSHPKSYKGSKEEAEDISLLESLGYEVENPYNPKFADIWQTEGIGFGKILVEMCEIFAFRPLSTGQIGAGSAKEIQWALNAQKRILEMPSAVPFDAETLDERALSIDETVEFFKTVGK